MRTRTKERIFDTAIYTVMVAASLAALLTAYSALYFAHHDSPYAEACPEQKTLFWCAPAPSTEKE